MVGLNMRPYNSKVKLSHLFRSVSTKTEFVGFFKNFNF